MDSLQEIPDLVVNVEAIPVSEDDLAAALDQVPAFSRDCDSPGDSGERMGQVA